MRGTERNYFSCGTPHPPLRGTLSLRERDSIPIPAVLRFSQLLHDHSSGAIYETFDSLRIAGILLLHITAKSAPQQAAKARIEGVVVRRGLASHCPRTCQSQDQAAAPLRSCGPDRPGARGAVTPPKPIAPAMTDDQGKVRFPGSGRRILHASGSRQRLRFAELRSALSGRSREHQSS